MQTSWEWLETHLRLTRRHWAAMCGATAWTVFAGWKAWAEERDPDALARRIAELEYLTAPEKFGTVERGKPLPSELPVEKLREVGLTRETWRLEVVADPEAPAKIERPLSKELGTALDWEQLMRLAETEAVRFLKVMTCNNGGSPLGTGLWEGVPLKTVVWLTRPTADLRRVFYYGYHNDDPAQRFQSSLPAGRVLEEPPGDPPVILCYKLNGQFLSGKRGGPVRMVVPENYGFKSVKWLQRVVLTNAPYANDTYANGNNDVDSWMKSFARFVYRPERARAGEPFPLTGFAQVGISGVSRVEYAVHPADEALPADDPYLTRRTWRSARLLEPPTRWGGGMPAEGPETETLWRSAHGFDSQTGRPRQWPLRYSLAHWAAMAEPLAAGRYYLWCRTIDARGVAQPLPRPFPKSGRNQLERIELTVEG